VTDTVGGQFIRKSLQTSDAERANRLVRQMEDAGKPALPESRVTVSQAVERYLAVTKALNRSAATLPKYTHDLQKQFLPWCESKGYVFLWHVADASVIREYRTSARRCARSTRNRLVKTDRGGDAVFLYTQKTGTHVYCPIPPSVAEELRNVPPGRPLNPDDFFWSGRGLLKSAVADWQRSYKKLFALAGITKRAHIHMIRDTFAIECLLSEIPLERVAILLGHSSVKITEKHYKPWVTALQHQLEDDVIKSWRDA
jgi:hypothetical protein